MPAMRARLLLPLVAAGCLWVPLGTDAVPRIELLEVTRASRPGVERAIRPGAEPGGRGWFFEDSLLAFRTQANGAGVRFRVWNRRATPVRIAWGPGAAGEPRGACPAEAEGWELRRSGAAADVVPPGASREAYAVAVARVPARGGGVWRPVPLACVAAGPAETRVPLRLAVETEAGRHGYTFWYGAAGASRR